MDMPQGLRKIKAVKLNLDNIQGLSGCAGREPDGVLVSLRRHPERWQSLRERAQHTQARASVDRTPCERQTLGRGSAARSRRQSKTGQDGRLRFAGGFARTGHAVRCVALGGRLPPRAKNPGTS